MVTAVLEGASSCSTDLDVPRAAAIATPWSSRLEALLIAILSP
jgi:hypothetical protein